VVNNAGGVAEGQLLAPLTALPLLLSLRYTAFWYSTDGDYLSEEPLLLRQQLRSAYRWCEGGEPTVGFAAESSAYYAPGPDLSGPCRWFGGRFYWIQRF
jgi:hypothetical protein